MIIMERLQQLRQINWSTIVDNKWRVILGLLLFVGIVYTICVVVTGFPLLFKNSQSSAASDLHSRKQKLLIILFDGVRWDYINNNDHPGFARLAREGVKA